MASKVAADRWQKPLGATIDTHLCIDMLHYVRKNPGLPLRKLVASFSGVTGNEWIALSHFILVEEPTASSYWERLCHFAAIVTGEGIVGLAGAIITKEGKWILSLNEN